MNNPRDFLPERYRRYLKKTNLVVLKKEKPANNLAGLFVVFFLVIGVFSSYSLSKQSQDNRQQASTGDPYPTISASPTESVEPDIKNRPDNRDNCKGSGVWVGEKCYVYWEVLPEGTHMVVPGEYNSYGYAALIPVDKAQEIQVLVDNPNLSVTLTGTPTATPVISIPPSNSNVNCGPEFKMVHNICMPDQKSEYWNSEWINKRGCGAMQALYYAMQKDSTVNPQTFLEKYYSPYINGSKGGNTYDSENISILEDLGYTVEPYTKSLIANGYKEIDDKNTFLVKGVFSGGVNHYFSINDIYTDENGRTIFNTVDSYYNIDKCIASTGNIMNCYDSDNKQVTSIDLSNPETSTYLVL